MSEKPRMEDIGFYVLEELKRLSAGQERHGDMLIDLKSDVRGLDVKSGIWGFIAGLIPVAVMVILEAVKH